jgi:hypothetical protein
VAVLIAGGPNASNAAKKLDLLQLHASAVMSMTQGRSWPGIIRYLNYVWVFGGNTSNVLTSVEKFAINSEVWTSVAPMRYPRVYFTPCIWKEEIYLASALPDHPTPVEVFNPLSELYIQLPLILQDPYYGSLAYIVEGQLLFLVYSRKLGKWDLNSNATELVDSGIAVNNKLTALSNCPVQRCGHVLAWPNCHGKLTRLDLRRLSLFEAN